jgi:hypothetical protein
VNKDTLRPLLVVVILAALALWIGSLPRSPERTPGSAVVDPSKTPPPWLVLRQGVRAFTGEDGGGATTLTICPSARLYKRWFTDATAVVPGCVKKPRDIPVTIGSDEIVSSGWLGEYFVFIRADKASWSTLQILSQDTKSGDRPGLYVQITGVSLDAGKKGWIYSLGLDVQGGGPLFFTPPSATEWR